MIIVIPCYNEFSRLPIGDYDKFLSNHNNTKICFVDDGSTDETYETLENLKKKFPASVILLKNEVNKGKAESIRFAINTLTAKNSSDLYAYLDADLATSLKECASYLPYLEQGKKLVFASRILRIGSTVERKFHRFLFGRIIASIISWILHIKVYDTQCGCKVFTKEIAQIAFKDPFVSRWLFDVEIFSRILNHFGREKALRFMEEVPVKSWIDKGESKVKLSYFFKLWIDLLLIWRVHNKHLKNG
ncbi:glycosyltransferase [Flagellimonas sp. S174]|uniref:glycosyltransferase n=1 Tax=Flagellimonas sp. S174 TaxID=3410790 RepID=UPI003BF4B38A